jgi:phage terminase large subunit-like protein
MAKFLPDGLAVDKLLVQLKLAAYPWQEQLFKSRAGMVLLNCSRQAGKSTCVAFLALLEALTIQEHLVLIVSPSARQSRLLLRKVRDFMLRMPLKAVQRAQASAEQVVFANLSKIVALPCKEETIRGYSSVGLLIIDEAARVPDELYHAVRPIQRTPALTSNSANWHRPM